jgi:poly(A) polymerase
VPHQSLKDYAIFIHSLLLRNGYEAYLVGGCVRDTLLGREPKDYDIATNASPDGVMRLFPGSDLVGVQFGVVLVREGPWQIEVATFRNDGEYSDGRRPDSVQFIGDPRHDAERRDFTINALFLDPHTGQIIDFVGGRADLSAGIIRAIGDPVQRFEEDHLRLLRAVRFAARFGFAIEARTFEAIQTLSVLVEVVAPERVRDEINRILLEGGAGYGLTLLEQSGLAERLGLPTGEAVRERLRRGTPTTVAVAWAALLLEEGPIKARQQMRRFRHSAQDTQRTAQLIENHGRVLQPWASEAEKKRFVRLPSHTEQLELHSLAGLPAPRDLGPYTGSELHPPPLLRGQDLLAAGIPQGPNFSRILLEAETRQLNGELTTRDQALAWLNLLR